MDENYLFQLDSIQNTVDELQEYINSLISYIYDQTGVPKEYMKY